METRTNDLRAFAERLGLHFEKLTLLDEALTHSSYPNERQRQEGGGRKDNQRLEFLGDSILGFIVSEYLFLRLGGEYREGEMTSMKSALVSEASLAKAADTLGLGHLLLMGRGEQRSGGAKRSSNLADALEAVIAAIYMECGLPSAQKFVLFALKDNLRQLQYGRISNNFKSRLQELVQREFGSLPIYEAIESSGPDHRPTYTVQVMIEGEVYAQGQGGSYKRAEQAGARLALRQLSQGQSGRDSSHSKGNLKRGRPAQEVGR